MSARVIVPKLFRRKDRWYVRVQVPKAMQERLGKKEYWVSLKTSDRQEAMRLAATVVSEKRAVIAMTFNRLEGVRKTLSKFTAEQREALFREAYSINIGSHSNLISEYEQSPFKTLQAFAVSREAVVENVVATLRISHGDHPGIHITMRSLAEANGIYTPEGTPAFEELRRICVDSFIEAKRNEIALLRGHAVHANPNPEIVDLSTGQPRDFTSLKVILARPEKEPERLSKLVVTFIENPNKSRSDKTKNSMRGSMEVVIEILGDSTPVDEITEADCERVRDLIMQLPPNFKKLPKLKNRPVEEMVRIARAQGMPRLSPTGVNTYLKWLTSFLNWCQRRGKIARLPTSFGEIKVADTVRKEDKRLPFSDKQLQTYFSSRVFKNEERSNCLFWASLIALWNGMRSNEICQLDTADVVEVDAIWGFDITHISATGDGDKSVKTGASIRLVPIHPKLIEFGFLDFHSSRPQASKLFGDISRGADGYYSTTFSKKSNRYLKEVGVHGTKHKFHSFRHNFRDALRKGRVDREVGKALGGWQRGNTEAFDIYGSGFPLDELFDELGRVDYPKVDWVHLKNMGYLYR